jgi:ribosomal protein S18 acetylase RimI-like enzyme
LSNPVVLRECTSADASTLAIVGAATLLEAFAGFIPGESLLAHCRKNHIAAAYISLFEQPETRVWVAEVAPAAAPVGYVMLTAPEFPAGIAQAGDIELRRIYLFSRWHGGGTGQRMVDQAIAGARDQRATRLLLGVHPENKRALAFYYRNGFNQIGTRTFQVGTSTFEDPILARNL